METKIKGDWLRHPGEVNGFEGEYRFLSNFYPVSVELDGEYYPSTEHAFQAAKSLDPKERGAIQCAANPAVAKKVGRMFNLRPDWEDVKVGIMLDLLEQKFEQPDLAKKLLATGALYLEETNWWGDTFWGVCKEVGQNMLGVLLMLVREKLARQKALASPSPVQLYANQLRQLFTPTDNGVTFTAQQARDIINQWEIFASNV